ncbi:hypothetical protein A0H81_06989 [Grifola frondosa]|uniref:Uncharacterized protein n=1 Tax=Grifola frondosa TaxID=5627 RepID=A0A1C7M813_GRIFR|nr:hypothetical protein A0H81_06989 [Grifola frondosa]
MLIWEFCNLARDAIDRIDPELSNILTHLLFLLLFINSPVDFYEKRNTGNAVKVLMDSPAPKARVKHSMQWREIDIAELVQDCQATLTAKSLPQSKKMGDRRERRRSSRAPPAMGDQACISSGFAQCVSGKFVIVGCDDIRSARTCLVCTMHSDAFAHIAATGSAGENSFGGWIGLVWVRNIVWLFPLDLIKFAVKATFIKSLQKRHLMDMAQHTETDVFTTCTTSRTASSHEAFVL